MLRRQPTASQIILSIFKGVGTFVLSSVVQFHPIMALVDCRSMGQLSPCGAGPTGEKLPRMLSRTTRKGAKYLGIRPNALSIHR